MQASATPDTVLSAAAITGAALTSAAPRKTYWALGLIFAAGVGVFGMMGLLMGVLMPKTVVMPELVGIVHFAFLFLLPLAGRLLDENPVKLLRLGLPGLAAVFLLGLFYENGLFGRMPLFYTLDFLQQVMLLIACTAMTRLRKTHAAFPLLIALPHCLYLAHTGGVALRGLAADLPYGIAAASLLLALGTACCLWRLRILLADNPELWALPRQEKLPDTAAELSVELYFEARLAAVAARYGLSERETQVLGLLMQGIDDQEAARRMDVKKGTIRTTIHRMKEKTGAVSRDDLTQLTAG